MKSYYCSNIYIKRVLSECVFFLSCYYQTFFRNCFLLKFLLHSRKNKTWFISSFNTEVSIRINDHWSHCPENKEEGNFSLLFALLMIIVLCLENCSFYTLDWYEEVLGSICVFWGDSGMTFEGNFEVYLCIWKVFHLKIIEGLLFLLRFLLLVFHFNLILVNIFLLLIV